MNKIILSVNHGRLNRVNNTTVVSESVNSLLCEFRFMTDDWDNTIKTAVFMKEKTCQSNAVGVLLNNDECIIPHEILNHRGSFLVGVFGTKDNYRIVSEWAQFKIVDGAYVCFEPPVEADETLYEQILNALSNKVNQADLGNLAYKNSIDSDDLSSNILLGLGRIHGPIKKIQNYLYYIEYDNYDRDIGEHFFLNRYNPEFGTCSSIRRDNFYGRNYDWYYDDKATFIINTRETNERYASIGVSGGIISNDLANNGREDDMYLYLPFITLDGINENGVVCSINVLPDLDKKGVTTGTNPGKPNVPMACLVRRILDEAVSVDDAINKIQNDYNIIAPNSENISSEMHFMIADKNKTCVVEFIDNQPTFIENFFEDKPIMTNFYLYGYDGTRESLTPHAMGIERQQILLNMFSRIHNIEDMISIMRRVNYTNAYSIDEDPQWYSEFSGIYQTFGNLTKDSDPSEYAPLMQYVRDLFANRKRDGKTWHTVHTSVYDINNQKLYISSQERDQVFVFDRQMYGQTPGELITNEDIEKIVNGTDLNFVPKNKYLSIDGLSYFHTIIPTKLSDLENDSDFLEEKIFDSYSAAAEFAENDPEAHPGLSLTVVDEQNDTVTVYVIANSRGELSQIGGSSSISDYNSLANKPQINGVTLVGNKDSDDLDLGTGEITNSEIEEILHS